MIITRKNEKLFLLKVFYFTVFVLFFIFTSVYADDRKIKITQAGRVYIIAEKDALDEIEERLSQKKDEIVRIMKIRVEERLKALFNPNFENVLYVVKEKKVFSFAPEYILPFDIIDHKGNVLFKKGHVVNPLKYVNIPFDLVFTNFTDDNVVKCLQKITDLSNSVIFVTKGNVIEIQKKYPGFMIYPATERVLKFFRIKGVPSVVRQKGDEFEVMEIPCRV